ncbi:MAG: 30S ribosomal protein S12 methylthiotransferase RimO [Clostridium sp.]|nr:30S ribosomal protein S12 methylthiotransferase RimO [Clostridium sp.]
MKKYKVGLVSLGCDKNRIDSEILLDSVSKRFEITNKAKESDIIIINTCGFIEKAKQESINTILEMANYKNTGKCKLLIATGCLTQRYGDELKELIPEIDIMLGVNDYNKLAEYIDNFINNKEKAISVNYSDSNINEGDRILTTNSYTAYLRIAEGCNNFCTYCVIPKIRGKFRSRTKESIIEEAKKLAKQGVKELILVAQDTTLYGTDLYGKKVLHELINDLSKIEEIKWIRLLYCYPEEIYSELIDEVKNNQKVAKYFDLPIQHINSRILKLMGRKTNREQIENTIKLIREKISNVVLRTSLIVGFPSETKEEFEELKDFLSEYKLDKVGVFAYSQEEGTPAARMDNQIDENIKLEREKELMILQKNISKEINELKIGNKYDILVEGYNGDRYYGRSMEMVPEVDGYILFNSEEEIHKGQFVKVEITKSTDYDLIGVLCYESC